jgi:DNA (cytosine-5)-methyltransferase 1
MRHGSLCSGIGGFDLAASWMGWENVFHCESDPFCQRVLKHYWPAGKTYNDVKTFKSEEFTGGIEILTAGFPCQPFSRAGNRAGKADDRYLWPEVLRIIKVIGPRWIVLENVAGLVDVSQPESAFEMEYHPAELFDDEMVTRAGTRYSRIESRLLGVIISELNGTGYAFPKFTNGAPVVLCIPACAVDAPHRRDRIWLVAYADGPRMEGWPETGDAVKGGTKKNQYADRLFDSVDWDVWSVEPPFRSVHDGLSAGLDGITLSAFRRNSLKSFGNAIVPQVAFQIFKAINAADTKTGFNTFNPTP